jgi:hypothetical protein
MTQLNNTYGLLALLTSAPLKLRLYSDKQENKLIECNGYGYEPKTLAPKLRKISNNSVEYPAVTIKFTGPIGLARGYYITDEVGKYVVGYYEFTSAIDVADEDGGSITIHPKLSV